MYLNPYWVLHIHFGPFFRFQWHTSPLHFGSLKVEVFASKSHAILDAKKNSVAGSMLDSFWDVLGFAGLHFGLRGLHVGSILCSRVQFRTHFGFQRHHWGPFNPILFVRKRLPLFRWYIFKQQTVYTCFNIDCGHGASVDNH